MSDNPYEFWLTDDAGRRILLLENIAYASFSRTTVGYGTAQIGIPFDALPWDPISTIQPDWRLDIWRNPSPKIPKRREGSFFIRKKHIYDRKTDSLRIVELFGRSPLDILRRWSVVSTIAAYYKKTDYIDDMMKDVVRESFITVPHVVPAGEFSVDGDLGLGPLVTQSFPGKTVLDVLKELKAQSLTKNALSSANRKIYFDVVEGPGLPNGFGYIFRTYADRRGSDRSNGVTFSVENGNFIAPDYVEDHLDAITEAQVGSTVIDSADRYLSRWNQILAYQAGASEGGADTSTANQVLYDQGKRVALTCTFLNSPGSDRQPQSLYGVDWDLGDLLPVQYAGKSFAAEVAIAYLAVDETGKETITGSNIVGAI